MTRKVVVEITTEVTIEIDEDTTVMDAVTELEVVGSDDGSVSVVDSQFRNVKVVDSK